MTKNLSLSQHLNIVQTELEKVIDSLTESLGYMEQRKDELIEAIVVSQEDPLDEATKRIVSHSVDDAIKALHQSNEWVKRFSKITIEGMDIAKSMERTWIDSLKEFMEKTKWYREMYPYALEQKQQEKEYKRHRNLPKTYYGPENKLRNELDRIRREDPEGYDKLPKDIKDKLESIKAQIEKRIKRTAEAGIPEINAIIKLLNEASSLIYNLVYSYFTTSGGNAILDASNGLASKIKSERGRKIIKPVLYQALSDEVRILESTFGSEGYPGPYLTSGVKAFLLPAMSNLQEVVDKLEELPWKQLSTEEAQREYERLVKLDLEETTKPQTSDTEARLQILITRRNITANRKRRLHMVQRIASLGKGGVFNG